MAFTNMLTPPLLTPGLQRFYSVRVYCVDAQRAIFIFDNRFRTCILGAVNLLKKIQCRRASGSPRHCAARGLERVLKTFLETGVPAEGIPTFSSSRQGLSYKHHH